MLACVCRFVNIYETKQYNLIEEARLKNISVAQAVSSTQHAAGETLRDASLVAQSVKNLPAVQETQVRSLGWEDPLEKEMATHPSILAWKISWTEEPGGLQSMGSQRVGHNWVTNTHNT